MAGRARAASGERQQRAFTPLWCRCVDAWTSNLVPASRGELAARTSDAVRRGAARRSVHEGVEIQIS